jgi:hypothetical protein
VRQILDAGRWMLDESRCQYQSASASTGISEHGCKKAKSREPFPAPGFFEVKSQK